MNIITKTHEANEDARGRGCVIAFAYTKKIDKMVYNKFNGTKKRMDELKTLGIIIPDYYFLDKGVVLLIDELIKTAKNYKKQIVEIIEANPQKINLEDLNY